ncbi:DUF3817 domain-containing protein [Paraconexibacter sp.]|uniref:DUF3817 domain-containing protein n=1 Tax=Paraconexibacter sp. TaxID=2949640 RepID=UPI0035685A28
MPDSATTVKKLNLIRLVAIADFLLLLVLLYVAVVDRNESAISVIGPIHGVGFLAQLYLVATGAGEGRWGWWFPAAVVVTGGPIGALFGDVKIRRELETATA